MVKVSLPPETAVNVLAVLGLQERSCHCAGNGGQVLAMQSLQERNLHCAADGGTVPMAVDNSTELSA